ncbi:MAG TPA: hypothetical protein VN814_15090 [Caulobacteraceae bacterium]|nr:hypothetical protein [Caulobacteraceae bacterium]
MTPEEDEHDRSEIIRRLEDEKQRIDRQLAKEKAQSARAESSADDPSFGTEFCRECFVELNERVPLTPQPGGYGEDVYHCRNGHERRVRRR